MKDVMSYGRKKSDVENNHDLLKELILKYFNKNHNFLFLYNIQYKISCNSF